MPGVVIPRGSSFAANLTIRNKKYDCYTAYLERNGKLISIARNRDLLEIEIKNIRNEIKD